MKKLFITLAVLFTTIAPSLNAMGGESVIEHQFREAVQQNMLGLIAKSNVALKMLTREVHNYQEAFTQLELLVASGNLAEVKKFMNSIKGNDAQAETDEEEGAE